MSEDISDTNTSPRESVRVWKNKYRSYWKLHDANGETSSKRWRPLNSPRLKLSRAPLVSTALNRTRVSQNATRCKNQPPTTDVNYAERLCRAKFVRSSCLSRIYLVNISSGYIIGAETLLKCFTKERYDITTYNTACSLDSLKWNFIPKMKTSYSNWNDFSLLQSEFLHSDLWNGFFHFISWSEFFRLYHFNRENICYMQRWSSLTMTVMPLLCLLFSITY